MFRNKSLFFSLFSVLLVIIVGTSSLKSIISEQVFAASGDGNGGGDRHRHSHSSHHRSDSSSANNNLPTSEPSPELTLGPSTEPEPLDCTKNPDDILCKVDCTTNPDDPLCTPPSPPPTPEQAPELTNTTSTSAAPQEFSFKETLEVSPNLKGVIISGPTNKFVDSIGAMHIVGELRNDGTKTLNVGQIVATIYGPSNRTLGLDYATPTPAPYLQDRADRLSSS